jgi:hypothetical protein
LFSSAILLLLPANPRAAAPRPSTRPWGEGFRAPRGSLHIAPCCGVPLRRVPGAPRRPASSDHVSLSSSSARPPDPGWLHEVKHDGYRIVARKQGESVSLWTRYATDFTNRLPRIAEAIGKLPAE